MPHLLVIDLRKTLRHFEIERSSTRVGRYDDNDLVLADPLVSRREHFRIDRNPDDRYYLHHINGKNPTRLNDVAVTIPTPLSHGDRIDVGKSALVFYERAVPTVLTDHELPDTSNMTVISSEDVLIEPLSDAPETEHGASTMDVVFEADRQLTLQSSLDDIFRVLLDLAQRIVEFDCALVIMLEEGRPFQRYVRLPDDHVTDSVAVSVHVVDQVVRERQAILVTDTRLDDLGEQSSITGLHILSLMGVPLLRNGNVFGLLYLDSRTKSPTFNPKNLKILIHLASVAAIKIENRQLVEREADALQLREELRRAADIQRHLLPREEPRIDGYVVTARTLPCMGVGGDWYDWMPAPRNGLHLCLGDIAGKGLSAAMLMSSAHATLRALSQMDYAPDEMMRRLNGLMEARFPYNRFVTLWYSVLDPDAHTLTFVNACQERPLYRKADGMSERLDSCGSPVGMLPETDYLARTISLAPNDLVIVYSDGIVDCRNADDEQFGEDRLLDLVAETADNAPPDIAEAILEAVDLHRGNTPHDDDVTLLLLKRLG